MTKLETLKQALEKAKARHRDFLEKAKKEEERIKKLDVDVKLEEWEQVTATLAERNLTIAELLEEAKEDDHALSNDNSDHQSDPYLQD